MKTAMKLAMAALAALASWSCAFAEQPAPGFQKLLFVYSGQSDQYRELINNLTVAFNTVKLNFKSLNTSSGESNLQEGLDSLGANGVLVILSGDFRDLEADSTIVRYVEGGGKAFFASIDSSDENMLSMAGVKKSGESFMDCKLKGEREIFPGMKDANLKYSDMNYSTMKVELEDDVETLFRSGTGNPVAWIKKRGKGKIAVFNASLPDRSDHSGMALQIMSLLDDCFVTTVFNARVFFIDDFPAPIASGSEYVISNNYNGIGYEEFYKEIWWPQIKELAVKRRLKYTCLILGDYQNSVKMPPEPLSPKMKERFKYYGEDLLKNGHELGIHGYNHASLLMADYKAALDEIGYTPWNSEKDMVRSLESLRATLDETFGKRQYLSYVPPMNMLSKEGKMAVLEAFPEMKCFAGVDDNTQGKSGVLFQNIGQDPDFPKVYALPRYSSGYINSEVNLWKISNYAAYCGMLSHFIHPDEIMDSERCENKNWKELYDDLDALMGTVDEKLPFLRPMTVCDFVAERERTAKTEVYSRSEGARITIEYAGKPETDSIFHYLRLNDGRKPMKIENGRITPIIKAEGLYLIEGLKSPVTITLDEKPAAAEGGK